MSGAPPAARARARARPLVGATLRYRDIVRADPVRAATTAPSQAPAQASPLLPLAQPQQAPDLDGLRGVAASPPPGDGGGCGGARDGNYAAQAGELLDYGRYEVLGLLGCGTFGQVFRAHDRVTHEDVAVKIVRREVLFYHQACVELGILQKLGALDPHGHHHIGLQCKHPHTQCKKAHTLHEPCDLTFLSLSLYLSWCVCLAVRLRHYFHHGSHLCLVFELLSLSLYDLLSRTGFAGVSLHLVRKIGRQLLTALAFLARPEIGVVHGDVKPENVLLCDPHRARVKLIDFGSAAPAPASPAAAATAGRYVQSRYYRAPEVLLGLPHAAPIDVWSLACVLAEMHTGAPLFPGTDAHDQLARIAALLGPPPAHMLAADAGTPPAPASALARGPRPVADVAHALAGIFGAAGVHAGHAGGDCAGFCDALARMLAYDPAARLTPAAALAHPFFHSPHAAPTT